MVTRDELRAKYGRQSAAATDAQKKALLADIRKCMFDGCPPTEAQAIVDRANQLGMQSSVPKEIVAAAAKAKPGGQSAKARERAFVVQGRESGRTVISAPLREVASKNEGFTYLRGRFVEADRPNGNGAMWTTDDLQMAEASVAGGPLNWLHDESKIIGTLLDAQLVTRQAAAAGDVGNHIVSNAAVWRFLFPQETSLIERAADQNQLWYSMECVSKSVMCTGDTGCGETFAYSEVMRQNACSHLRERSSIRRFVDPIFLGGAIIVPPVRPGWANADVEVVRQAAGLLEQHGDFEDEQLTKPEAQAMVSSILTWANRAA